MEDLKTASGFSIMQTNRMMNFDKDTIEKLKYLKEIKKEGNVSDICNKALIEFLKVKFEKLHLEHYRDEAYEERVIAGKRKMEEDAKARDDFRLLEIAKARILQNEMAKIRIEEAKIREEEERTGIKVPKFEMVKVALLKLINFEGKTLQVGDKIDVTKITGLRWQKFNIARIIK